MREPAKKDPTRRGKSWRAICKGINHVKNANERIYVDANYKNKNKESIQRL